MKKLWLFLSLLISSISLTGCFNNQKPEIKEEQNVNLYETFEGRKQICEYMIKKELISDNYFSEFKEVENDNSYLLVGYVWLDTGKAPISCVVYKSGEKPYFIVENTDNNDLLIADDMIQLDYWLYDPDSHTTAEMIELWWKTILSYPYNPGWWQTGISQFWRSIPKFKKITYVWDKQTEKDKWYCKLLSKDDFIYEPCLEYSVEWIFIDENGNEKEFKNLKIMVWTLVNWYFEIMASWF